MSGKLFRNEIQRILYLLLSVSLFLTGCGKAAPVNKTGGESREEQNTGNASEYNSEEAVACPDKEPENEEDGAVNAIVGTWQNTPDPEREWMTSYQTCFSPDGRAVHNGFRNVDFGTWAQDGDIYTVYFDDCSYFGVDDREYDLPSYTVTCRVEVSEDGKEKILHRNTERETEISLEVEAWDGTGKYIYTTVDQDDYGCPLSYESDCSYIYDNAWFYYPKIAEYGDLLKKKLLEIAGRLTEGTVTEQELEVLPYTIENIVTYDFTGDGREEILVHVETFGTSFIYDREEAIYIVSPVSDGNYIILAENTHFKSGYTDILAPDGTELLSLTYASPSSWKGGVRYHLGYREGEIVVEKEERYNFHWNLPLINRVKDFENGVFYIYVARNPDEGTECYGYYIDLEDSIKIDEEKFEPAFRPFTGYSPEGNDYPAVYPLCHPFPEGWWQDGGRYPEEREAYEWAAQAHWIDEAKDDNPDEMLREAVEKSGYEMEKKAYPWTEETKENVIGLLRCPVADYYYISEDYVAYYALGKIYFDEIEY